MEEDSGMKITGRRELSTHEIELINEIKAKGIYLEMLIDNLERSKESDPRWLEIGKTHLQQGIMALVRAVAKPDNF